MQLSTLVLFFVVSIATAAPDAGVLARSLEAPDLGKPDCTKNWPLSEVLDLLQVVGEEEVYHLKDEGCGVIPVTRGSLLFLKNLYDKGPDALQG
jgi:hypothetical protein